MVNRVDREEHLRQCAYDLQFALMAEVDELGAKLSNKLTKHFAKAVAESCFFLHHEHIWMHEASEGIPPSTPDLKATESTHMGLTRESTQAGPTRESTQLGPELHSLGSLHSLGEPLPYPHPRDSTPKTLSALPLPLERLNSDDTKGDANALLEDPSAEKEQSFEERALTFGPRGSNDSKHISVKGWTNERRTFVHTTSELKIHAHHIVHWWSLIIVTSRWFDGFFNMVIGLNCLTMGAEAQQLAKGPINTVTKVALDVLEHAFTTLFSIELTMKYYAFGWKEFVPWKAQGKDATWNFLDAILVLVTGVLFTWAMPLLSSWMGVETDNSSIRLVSVFRAVRLVRLVRVVQRSPIFREAWILIRGLSDSSRTLFWTCIVIMAVTYMFAVFGLTLFSTQLYDELDKAANDPQKREELTELLNEYMGSLDTLMAFLVQVLTLDSWNSVVRRLKKFAPQCWLFFYLYIAVVVFVLMNLVTAIIVDNAVAHSRRDEDHALSAREKVKKEELRQLEDLFKALDRDGSGTLCWQEFESGFMNPTVARKWQLLDFEQDECKELFGLLDDGDGEIETTEFFEGLGKMKGHAQSKDIFRLQKCVESLVRHAGLGLNGKLISSTSGGASTYTPKDYFPGAMMTTREFPEAPGTPSGNRISQRHLGDQTTEFLNGLSEVAPTKPTRRSELDLQFTDAELVNDSLVSSTKAFLNELAQRSLNGGRKSHSGGTWHGTPVDGWHGNTMIQGNVYELVPHTHASVTQNPGRSFSRSAGRMPGRIRI